jgi:hypothetical protein
LNKQINNEKGKGKEGYFRSMLNQIIGNKNKKQKGTFSFMDFRAYKIAREIESHSKGRRASSFTQLELALISKGIIQRYLGDTKYMKTVRSIIDYQYRTYTFKVLIFDAALVWI